MNMSKQQKTAKKQEKKPKSKPSKAKDANNGENKSELGITVKKAEDFSDWYTQVIQKADLIEYSPVSGCMVIKPYSYAMWEYAQQFLDKEFKALGVKNAYFPLLIPESLLKKEQDHVEGFTPEVAWVTEHGNTKFEERLAIRPTSETIMYDSFKKWIRSKNRFQLTQGFYCNPLVFCYLTNNTLILKHIQ